MSSPFTIKLFGVRIAIIIFAFAALSLGASQSPRLGIVNSGFRGEWIPLKAVCPTSPLRLKIDASVVTFINGEDRAEYRKLDQCLSCMGHDVQNIALLTTDAQGDSPFTIYLDGSKKINSIQVDFGNDKALGRRFPFGTASLKKCVKPAH